MSIEQALNILIVHPPQDLSGPHQVSYRLLRELCKGECFHFHVFIPGEGVAADQLRALKVKLIIMPQLKVLYRTKSPLYWAGFMLNLAVGSIRLWHYIRRNRINLVHTTDSLCLTGGVAARLAGVPSIHHVHGLTYVSPPAVRWLTAQILALTGDRILFISEATRQAIPPPPCAKDKALVIYNGVDLIEFRPGNSREQWRRKFGLELDQPVVACIGNLEKRKGQEYFVRACARVRQVYPDVRFLVVGGMHSPKTTCYGHMLKRLVQELGVEKNVIFTGIRYDIPDLLNAVDLVVQPSLSEAFGLAAAEASSCGVPVVATRVGGLPEVVRDGETGLLVPPADSEALAEAIIALLGDENRRNQMGSAGRRRVEQLFDVRKQGKAIASLYKSLVLDAG